VKCIHILFISHAAKQSVQDALGEKLADQAQTAGAERSAHGHLSLAPGGAGEQQVGNVGAGDEQDERHGAEQHKQGGAGLAYDFFTQLDEPDAPPFVGWILLLEARGEDIPFGLGAFPADAGAEARSGVQVMGAARVAAG